MSLQETPRMAWLRMLAQLFQTDAIALQPQHGWMAPLAVFPGREGLPWSLGSVLGAAVARFLPHGYRHERSGFERKLSDVFLAEIQVSADGMTVLLFCRNKGSETGQVALYRWTGSTLVLQVAAEAAVKSMCMARDGTLFALTCRYHAGLFHRVVDLSLPSFTRGAFIYQMRKSALSVEVNDVYVFVLSNNNVEVVSRSDAVLRYTIGKPWSLPQEPGYINMPLQWDGLCLLGQAGSAQRIAVAEMQPARISVFTVQGTLLWHWDLASMPDGCAFRAVSDELIVRCLDDIWYIFKGLMSHGASSKDDIVVTRRLVHQSVSIVNMKFCGVTALTLDRNLEIHSYV